MWMTLLCWALWCLQHLNNLSKLSMEVFFVTEAVTWEKSNQTSINSIGHPVCSECLFLLSIICGMEAMWEAIWDQAIDNKKATQTIHSNPPLIIWINWTRTTTSRARTLPQTWCSSHDQPQSLCLIPMRSTWTPVGWYMLGIDVFKKMWWTCWMQ